MVEGRFVKVVVKHGSSLGRMIGHEVPGNYKNVKINKKQMKITTILPGLYYILGLDKYYPLNACIMLAPNIGMKEFQTKPRTKWISFC
jgi:hypothetical protein